MSNNLIVLRPAAAVRIIWTLVSMAAVWSYVIHQHPFGLPEHFRFVFVPCLVVFCAVQLAVVLLRRIVLHTDCIRFVSRFRAVTNSPADIIRLTCVE